MMFKALVAVLVVVPVINPAAQAPAASAEDGKREITVSGCLLRSGYAGYQVDEAQVDAIDGKPMTPQGASPATGGAATPKKWILEGGGNLGPRVGEKVQVVGRSDWQSPTSSTAADEPPNRTPRLTVQSLKTIAAKCA